MKKSEYLHHLIRSMDKRDKDNLMRYARMRGKKTDHKYLEFFRAIDAQATYNEAVLKEAFSFSNFSEAKRHLLELILRVLRIFDQHPETEMQNRPISGPSSNAVSTTSPCFNSSKPGKSPPAKNASPPSSTSPTAN